MINFLHFGSRLSGLSGLVQDWFRIGSGLSGLVQDFQDWFRTFRISPGLSGLVQDFQDWFKIGSGLVQDSFIDSGAKWTLSNSQKLQLIQSNKPQIDP